MNKAFEISRINFMNQTYEYYGFIFFILVISIWNIYTILDKNRTIEKNKVSIKVYLYALAENSFLPEKNIFKKSTIQIPFKVLIIAMLKKYFNNFKQLYFLFGFIFLLALVSVSFLVKVPHFDLFIAFEIYFFIFIVLVNFKSMSNEMSFFENNIQFISDKLNETIDSSINIENLINEIKLDFDLYKIQTPMNSLIIASLIPFILFYFKLKLEFSLFYTIFLVVSILLFILVNFIYRKYRSNIIYITIQALHRYHANKS